MISLMGILTVISGGLAIPSLASLLLRGSHPLHQDGHTNAKKPSLPHAREAKFRLLLWFRGDQGLDAPLDYCRRRP